MNADMAALVARARLGAGGPDGAPQAPDAERLKQLAAEFESMFLVQMLREMRQAGRWDDEEEGGDLHSLFETIDLELASYLSRARGMGLSDQLLDAFTRLQSQAADPATEAGEAPPAPREMSPVQAPATIPAETLPVTPAEVPADAPPLRPVPGGVTSEFGWRRDPFTSGMTFHRGVDLRAAYGEEVRAAGAGRVAFSGERQGYGTSVIIEHADGTRTLYAHLAAALVRAGDRVGGGEPVGRAGSSGRATGPHLHFEVISADGRRLPPGEWGLKIARALPIPQEDHQF